jgi:anti-sigma factor RsiW
VTDSERHDVDQHDVELHDVEQLSCREVVELVTAYLEGALSREERARFETHLAACGGCTAYLEQMSVTIRLTGTLRVQDISADVEAELVAAFRGWKL